jgi:hypothetical protein
MISPGKIEYSARSVALKLRESALASTRMRPVGAVVLYAAGRVGLVEGPRNSRRFPLTDTLPTLPRDTLPDPKAIADFLTPLLEQLGVSDNEVRAVHGLRGEEPLDALGQGIPCGMEGKGSARVNLAFPFCVLTAADVRENGTWGWANIEQAAYLITGGTPRQAEAVAHTEMLDRTVDLISRLPASG